MSDAAVRLAEQYQTESNLRIRIETHQRFTVGPALEPAVDLAISLASHEDLLDVGTGPGDFPGRLRTSGHRGRLVGVDASPGMIAKARSAYPNVEFTEADAQSLPFADASFDVVTARHMLYHVPDIPLALREIFRVLRPGGRFLAITNARDNMRGYVDAIREAADSLTGTLASELLTMMRSLSSSVFTEENGPTLIREVFGNVHISFVESALRFPDADPAIRYFDSCRSLKGLTPEQWRPARAAFAKIATRQLERGPWNIPKRIVLLTARKSPYEESKNR